MAKAPSKVPKSDSPKTGKGKAKVVWQGYVNLSLTDGQKAGYSEWARNADVWGNEIPTLLDSGYNLSISFDDYHESMVAGLYCVNHADANAGWKLTAHAADAESALGRLLYIHCVLLEGSWSGGFRPEVDAW